MTQFLKKWANQRNLLMHKFLFYSSLSFLFFFIISRFLFPFNDEPDVSLKTLYFLNFFENLINFDKQILYNEFISNINVQNNCGIISSVDSIWTYINQHTCFTPNKLILFNTLFTLILVSPIFILAYLNNLTKDKTNYKFFSPVYIDSIILSFLYGSFLFHIGFFSPEKIGLFLSISFFFFLRNYLLLIIIAFILLSVDIGSFIIVITFFFTKISVELIIKYFSFKNLLISIILLIFFLILILLFILNSLLSFNFLPVSYQYLIQGMNYTNSDNTFTMAMNNYPFYYRMIYFVLSFIYISPQDIKVPILYLYNFIAILLLLYKIINKKIITNKLFYENRITLDLIAALFTISVFFVFFPINVNAKNFIFLLPVFFNFTLYFYSRFQIFNFIIINNLILFYFLTLYRL